MSASSGRQSKAHRTKSIVLVAGDYHEERKFSRCSEIVLLLTQGRRNEASRGVDDSDCRLSLTEATSALFEIRRDIWSRAPRRKDNFQESQQQLLTIVAYSVKHFLLLTATSALTFTFDHSSPPTQSFAMWIIDWCKLPLRCSPFPAIPSLKS